jgi:hypothetical protein
MSAIPWILGAYLLAGAWIGFWLDDEQMKLPVPYASWPVLGRLRTTRLATFAIMATLGPLVVVRAFAAEFLRIEAKRFAAWNRLRKRRAKR